MDKVVADTSVVISGQLASQIESGSIRSVEVIIPQAVVDELQSQASSGRGQGFVGLQRLDRLREMAGQFGLEVSQRGQHVSSADIDLAGSGRIDAIITDVARDEGATLYTSDKVQHLAAKSQGIPAVFLRDDAARGPSDDDLEFLRFFDSDTMSVHLKERQPPLAKRGRPGEFKLVEIPSDPLDREYLETLSSQIIDAVNATEQSTIEISMEGATVVQHGDYRIAMTRPPFSESFEITIVHPTTKMSLSDYDVSEALTKRLGGMAEGIVIAGPPGSGKSTLASSLGNFYHQQGQIVKTFESPRDLQVDSGVTQYSKLEGSFENTADILLLVRPDYTIFDEVRRREDFETFADLRMTGVGMVGVVHANSPIDAIQRFIGKIELGMIPNVLDTVIFVRAGRIDTVYDLRLEVKVPSGMTESDLARPVIVVRDLERDRAAYEVYTFGEENVIVPISPDKAGGRNSKGVYRLASEKVLEVVRKYDRRAEVEFSSEDRARIVVSKKHKARIIGKGGSKIDQLQDHLGIHLDVRTREEMQETAGLDAPPEGGDAGARRGGGGGGGGGGGTDPEYGGYNGVGDFGGNGHNGGGDTDDDDGDDADNDYGSAADYDNYRSGRERRSPRSSGRRRRRGSDGADLRFSFSSDRNLILIDVGRKHHSRNVEIVGPDGTQVATGRTNKKGVVKISTRAPGGRAILDADSPGRDIAVRLAD